MLHRAQNTNKTKHSISVKSQQLKKDAEPVASAIQKQKIDIIQTRDKSYPISPWLPVKQGRRQCYIKINKIFFTPHKEADESSSYRNFRKQARQVSYADSLGVPKQLHQREVALYHSSLAR